MAEPTFNVEKARLNFPSIYGTFSLFADNGAGTQAASQTVSRITNYMTYTYVQPTGRYLLALEAKDRLLNQAPQAAMQLFNARSEDQISWGMGSSANLDSLARVLEGDVEKGEEIIITYEHEGNTTCWINMAKRAGAEIKYWLPRPENQANPYSVVYHNEDLLGLITKRTRIIAWTPASNILGTAYPVKELTLAIKAKAKELGARKVDTVVDLVAWIPHAYVDVTDWEVDYAVISYYKLFGPRVSAMYTRDNVIQRMLPTLIPADFVIVENGRAAVPRAIQYTGPGFELVFGSIGSFDYLRSLSPSGSLKESFRLIGEHQIALTRALLDFLCAPAQWDKGVRILGKSVAEESRVPTISFVVDGKPSASKDIVDEFVKEGNVSVNNGAFGTAKMLEWLGIDLAYGVVRISLVNYNTIQEVEKIIAVLKRAFAKFEPIPFKSIMSSPLHVLSRYLNI